MKINRSTHRKRLGARITEALTELHDALARGQPLENRFTVRTVEIADPGTYSAKAVRATRARLSMSQAVFAKVLGVSPELIQHWEQGLRTPQPIACRLLDEINNDPDRFLRRLVRAAG